MALVEPLTSDESIRPDRSLVWLGSLVIFILTFLAYLPAWHGGILWDDAAHITQPSLQTWSGLREIWFHLGATQQYYPVLHSAFWWEHRLWGDSVLGYHLVNITLHATSACLFALVLVRLRSMTGRPRFGVEWLAGAVFALHPICVESVAWISEQKNTLSTVFYLLAALAYLRFDRERKARWYILGLGLFLFALLSKSVTATLPAALLLMIWRQRGTVSWRRDVTPLAPWISVGMGVGLLTAWVEKHYIGAHGAAFDLSLTERCFLAGRVFWFYLGKLCWPANLMFIYPHWKVGINGRWAGGVVAFLIVTGLFWAFRRWSRWPLAAWLFFAGSLFPALGFFNVYPFIFSYVADHWQYLASLGPIAFFVCGGAELARRWIQPKRSGSPGLARPVCLAFVGAAVAGLFILTHRQAGAYRDGETLYKDTLAKNPACWMADNNLGLMYLDRGKVAEATDLFHRAIALRSDYADAYNNLGNALAKTPGRLAEAIPQYETSLRLVPNDTEVLINFGNALAGLGRLPDALAQFQHALQLSPSRAEVHLSIGSLLLQLGQRLGAIAEYRWAVQLKPDSSEANFYLARALRGEGDGKESLFYYQQALRLAPGSAEIWNSYGSTLLRREALADACEALAKAVEFAPESAIYRNNLGIALTKSGRLNDAVGQLKKAVALDPGFKDAHYNLGLAWHQLGREQDAEAEFAASGRL